MIREQSVVEAREHPTATVVPVHAGTGVRRRTLVLAFAVAALVIAGTGFSANLIVNPLSEFPWKIVEPLTPNEPREKLARLEAMEVPPNILILGSSRAGRLEPAFLASLGDGPAFNAAKTGGRLEDNMAFYRYQVGRGHAPTKLLWAMDVTMLQPGSSATWWTRADPDLGPLTSDPVRVDEWAATLMRSFRWTYFRDDAKAVLFALTEPPTPYWTIESDGHLAYPDIDPALATGTYDLDTALARYRDFGVRKYGSLGPPGQEELQKLQRFLHEASRQGTLVQMFITPLHPTMVESLQGTDYADAESTTLDALERLCVVGNLELYDFRELASFGGDPADWHDMEHYGFDNARAILTSLHGDGAPDLCG